MVGETPWFAASRQLHVSLASHCNNRDLASEVCDRPLVPGRADASPQERLDAAIDFGGPEIFSGPPRPLDGLRLEFGADLRPFGGRAADEMHRGRAVAGNGEGQVVFRQIVVLDDLAQHPAKFLRRAIRARFLMEERHPAGPALLLVTGVLASDPVEGAFETARKLEVVRVHRQHRLLVDHALIDPIGEGDPQGDRLFGDGIDLDLPRV